MPNGYTSSKQILTSQAATNPVQISPTFSTGNYSGGYLQPGIIVNLSSGATITYNVEVTGDDVSAPNYATSTQTWTPFTGMAGLTASTVGTLGAQVSAIRVNCTSYGSGTLTFFFVQASIP